MARRSLPRITSSTKLRFWGITPSSALLEEPETNGLAARFIRILREQAFYARSFRTAAAAFVPKYHQHWLVEKNGFQSLARARDPWVTASLPVAARSITLCAGNRARYSRS